MKHEIYIPIQRDQLREIYKLDEPHKVIVKPVSQRTLDQNAKLHAMLADVSRQVEYCGKYRSVEDWKDIFAAAIKMVEQEEEIVPGLEGGVVVLGLHTSDMTIAQIIKMIEYIYAWASDSVVWSEQP